MRSELQQLANGPLGPEVSCELMGTSEQATGQGHLADEAQPEAQAGQGRGSDTVLSCFSASENTSQPSISGDSLG